MILFHHDKRVTVNILAKLKAEGKSHHHHGGDGARQQDVGPARPRTTKSAAAGRLQRDGDHPHHNVDDPHHHPIFQLQ